ncbi:unnamed protein product, partial [Rotaria sordida]
MDKNKTVVYLFFILALSTTWSNGIGTVESIQFVPGSNKGTCRHLWKISPGGSDNYCNNYPGDPNNADYEPKWGIYGPCAVDKYARLVIEGPPYGGAQWALHMDAQWDGKGFVLNGTWVYQ